MHTPVIAFINFKGGVGKTANAVNIAATIAKHHYRRVLLVDLDAQCNASLWLLDPRKWQAHTRDNRRTVYQIFLDALDGTRLFRCEDAVLRGVPRERDYPLLARLDLLPSTVRMMVLEDQLCRFSPATAPTLLAEGLKNLSRQYDYIFLDCPPNLFHVTRNALFAADHLIVPFIPDYLSLSGLAILAEVVETFYRGRNPHAKGIASRLDAFIVNRYEQTGRVYATNINELQMKIDTLKERGKIADRAVILQPYIRTNVHVAESTHEHLPVILHKPESIGAQDYAVLTQNFMTFFEGRP